MKQKEAYKKGTDYQFKTEEIKLGPFTSYSLLNDPMHMCFVLARYKFVSKMLEHKETVLEIGCGDAFGLPIVAKNKEWMLAIDSDIRLISSNENRLFNHFPNVGFATMDICKVKPFDKYESAFAIDVIEHLDHKLEPIFMKNICDCLTKNSILIMGTPNKTANKYATHRAKVQHINLHDHKSLRKLMEKYFKNVFIFSMNDEVVHTGFAPMAHYLFGVGVGKK